MTKEILFSDFTERINALLKLRFRFSHGGRLGNHSVTKRNYKKWGEGREGERKIKSGVGR